MSRDTESRPGTARVPGHAPNFRDTRVPAHMSASWDTLTLYWDSADASWDTCFLGHADTLLAQPCPGTRLRVPGRPHTVLGHVHRVLGHLCPGTRVHRVPACHPRVPARPCPGTPLVCARTRERVPARLVRVPAHVCPSTRRARVPGHGARVPAHHARVPAHGCAESVSGHGTIFFPSLI